MIERYAAAPGEVGGVLVGHTAFDHAVDAPALARRYGARAYGSASLGHLMRLHGLGELAVEVVPHEPYELGPFVVRFVPSRHSKLLFGRKVPMHGELTCDHLHYDNFFSLLGQPQDFVARVKLAEVPREVGQVARDAQVAALPRIDS
jgi:hypothetical protein